MKPLEELFRQIGTFPKYGIAYNILGLEEVRFLDNNMNETVIREVPRSLARGIYIFSYQDGELVSIGGRPK
ncbi:hypothetical protein OAK75_08665 [Bacteriovoracales bacterium]|nr:hypothetical protein [Bacteriovoracales bacterium]